MDHTCAVHGIRYPRDGTVWVLALPNGTPQKLYRGQDECSGAAAVCDGGTGEPKISTADRAGASRLAVGRNPCPLLPTPTGQTGLVIHRSGKKTFTVEIDDWFRGTLDVQGNREIRQMTVTSTLHNLDLERFAGSPVLGDVRMSGKVDGKITLTSRNQDPWRASYDVTLTKFSTTHSAAGPFRQKPMSGAITGSATLNRHQLRIKDMIFRSQAFRADISGVFIPGNPLSSSRLELTAKIRGASGPPASGQKRSPGSRQNAAHLQNGPMSFIIRGTLDNPSVQISRRAD